MKIHFEKENNETKIFIKFIEKEEKFDYINFRNYLFLGKIVEDINFSSDFSFEEITDMKNMLRNIEKNTIKKDDLLKRNIY